MKEGDRDSNSEFASLFLMLGEIKEEKLEEFKKMYEVMYGIQLNNEKASEHATRLVLLVKTVYGESFPKRFDSFAKKREQ